MCGWVPCGSPLSSHPSLSPAPSVLCVLHRPLSPLCMCSVAKSCLTLRDSMDWSLGCFQAKILQQVAISFFRGSSPPRDQTGSLVSALAEISLPLCHLGSPNIRTLHWPGIRTQTSHVEGKNATTEPIPNFTAIPSCKSLLTLNWSKASCPCIPST